MKFKEKKLNRILFSKVHYIDGGDWAVIDYRFLNITLFRSIESPLFMEEVE